MNDMKYLKKSILVIILLLTFAPLATHLALANQEANGLSQENSYEEIDTYIEKQLDTLNIPGASLAIIEGDKIVHTKAFGMTGSGGEAPTPQTPFFIGSLTKSFTALAVMQLVEAGKIDLDAPVQQYLPWFTLADPQASAQITVRHLLNQTSGISQFPGMIGLANFDNTPGANERQMRALATLKPVYPAGSGWEYSNVNFNLLGLVIESTSGETYADYVQNHIYMPLSMEHSFTSKATAQQDNLAIGHQQWFGFPVAVPNMPAPVASLPSGQLISSAEDVGHYLIAQLNKGEYDDAQILSAEGIAQMHQPAADASASGMGEVDYGMGWFIKQSSQGQLIYHYGEVPDYFAYMALLPEQNRAMVLLVNTNHQLYTFALLDAGEAAALQLAGVSPKPNAWGILSWAMPAILIIPILQIIFIIVTLLRIKRWKANPDSRPGVVSKWLLYILLPTIFNLLLVFTAVSILATGMLNFIMLFMGDIISTLLVSGAIALVWLCIRTQLILSTLQKPQNTSLLEKTMLIDKYLPKYDFTEVYDIEIEATPEVAYRAVNEATLGDMSVVVRLLLWLRAIPDRIMGNKSMDLDSRTPIITQQSDDSIILEQQAPHEIVLGMIMKGRVWEKQNKEIKLTHADDFLAFKDPEHCWVVSHLRVDSSGTPGTVIVRTESRTMGLSQQATKEFKSYWRIIKPFSGLIRRLMLNAIKYRAEIIRTEALEPA